MWRKPLQKAEEKLVLVADDDLWQFGLYIGLVREESKKGKMRLRVIGFDGLFFVLPIRR